MQNGWQMILFWVHSQVPNEENKMMNNHKTACGLVQEQIRLNSNRAPFAMNGNVIDLEFKDCCNPIFYKGTQCCIQYNKPKENKTKQKKGGKK